MTVRVSTRLSAMPGGGGRARRENSGRRRARYCHRMAGRSQEVPHYTEGRLDTSVAAVAVRPVLASEPDTEAAYPKLSPTVAVERVAETGIYRLAEDSFLWRRSVVEVLVKVRNCQQGSWAYILLPPPTAFFP